MQDHRVTGREVGHGRSDLLDPACILMTEGERQPGMRQMLPLALIDMQIGPTESGCSNADQDVEGALYCRLRDLMEGRTFVVPVKPYCLH
jgi:hypothetical protein